MYTLLLYLLWIPLAAFLMRTPGIPILLMTLIHYCFVRPIFGWGKVPDFEAVVYYAVIAIGAAMVGRLMSWALGTRSIISGVYTKNCFEGGFTYLLRYVKFMILLAVDFAAVACFEYIKQSIWIGGVLALIIALIGCVLFYFMFQHPTTENYNAFFFDKIFADNHVRNLPMNIALFLGFQTFITIAIFWPVVYAGYWQVWPAVSIVGFFAIVYFVLYMIYELRKVVPEQKELLSAMKHRMFDKRCPEEDQ
jgi:hypothetical protein